MEIEIVQKMNELLEADEMDNAVLEEICQTLKEQTNVRFRLMDFKLIIPDQYEPLIPIQSEPLFRTKVNHLLK